MQNPNGLRILIAEDNVINQMLFTKMLAVLGYKADIAESGTDAVEAFRGSAVPYCIYGLPDAGNRWCGSSKAD